MSIPVVNITFTTNDFPPPPPPGRPRGRHIHLGSTSRSTTRKSNSFTPRSTRALGPEVPSFLFNKHSNQATLEWLAGPLAASLLTATECTVVRHDKAIIADVNGVRLRFPRYGIGSRLYPVHVLEEAVRLEKDSKTKPTIWRCREELLETLERLQEEGGMNLTAAAAFHNAFMDFESCLVEDKERYATAIITKLEQTSRRSQYLVAACKSEAIRPDSQLSIHRETSYRYLEALCGSVQGVCHVLGLQKLHVDPRLVLLAQSVTFKVHGQTYEIGSPGVLNAPVECLPFTKPRITENIELLAVQPKVVERAVRLVHQFNNFLKEIHDLVPYLHLIGNLSGSSLMSEAKEFCRQYKRAAAVCIAPSNGV
eukprot:Platyproteum_vivax@DN14063_c0_g1_i1.p1